LAQALQGWIEILQQQPVSNTDDQQNLHSGTGMYRYFLTCFFHAAIVASVSIRSLGTSVSQAASLKTVLCSIATGKFQEGERQVETDGIDFTDRH